MHDFSTPTQDSRHFTLPKTGTTTLPMRMHKKSNSSIQSLKFSDRFSTLSSQTESLRLNYQLDQIKSENKYLKQTLQEKTEFFQSEIKKREDIIFSMSSMVRDRENQFIQVLEAQEKERNSIIGSKEVEIERYKKQIQDLKQDSSSFEPFDLLKTQEKEIESLRKVLKMTENENNSLIKRVQNSDPLVYKEKWKENEKQWKDLCFELSILVDAISRFRSTVCDLLKEDSDNDHLLQPLPPAQEDITKSSLIPVIKENVKTIKTLQNLLLDLYAGRCSNFCSLQ